MAEGKRKASFLGLVAAAWSFSTCVAIAGESGGASEGSRPVLAHDVFFTLNDASPAAREKLTAACRTYLRGHEGAVSFAVGMRATESTRPVNDVEFDVALHVYFKDAVSHDAYQEHPRHKRFIAEMSSNWKRVRVFDSWVQMAR